MQTRLALLILAIVLLISACHKKNEQRKVEVITVGKEALPQDSIENMIARALNNNDTVAYKEVAFYHVFVANMENEFLITALRMANKYNNPEACYHVSYILANSTRSIHAGPKEALEHMDTKTRNFALYYLIKSQELGYDDSKYQIHEIFGKDTVLPKSSYYLNEFVKQE